MDASDTMRLAPAIDLAKIGAVRHDLIERRGSDLTIDASAVEKIGGQGIQILLAAQSAWDAAAGG
jgi:chemotaxis protein CheX